MAFLTSYRAEKVYFEKLRSNIDIAKSYIQRGATDEVMALLQNAVDADGAIMLCYRNLGEVWADLAAQLEKTQKALEDLKTALEEYHDDLNKKIDEINNYLVRLINALDDRVTILENESKVKFAYLNHDSVEDVYSIEYNGETADFDALSAALEYPHLLVLIDNENGDIYYPRSVSDVLIDFHTDGVSGTDYVDISVTITDTDVVSVAKNTVVNYTFGAGFNVSNTNEVTPDLTVLQAKLTAGTGIEINAQNEISSTVKGNFAVKVTEDNSNVLTSDKTYAQIKAAIDAGQIVTLTLVEYAAQDVEKVFKLQDNDETSGSEALTFVYDEIVNGTSATQTVLTITSADAISKTDNVLTGGGSSYAPGTGIVIDSNNISNACWWDSEETVINKNTDTSTTQNIITGQRAFWIYRSGVFDLFPASVDSSKVIGVLFHFDIPASAFTQNLKNAIKNLPNKAINLDFKSWWVDIMYDDNGATIHQYYYLEGWNAQTYVYTVSGLDYIDNPFGTIEKFVRVDNQHNYKIQIGGSVQCSIVYDDGTDHTAALQAFYNSRFGFNIKATLKGKTGMK